MGIGNKLKAFLTLDIRKFRRSTKAAKKDIASVGDEAEKTSASSVASFRNISAGVIAIGAAAVAAASRITEVSNAIAKAADDAARFQAQVGKGLAQQLGGEDVTRVARLFGQSNQEFNLRTARLAQRFDLTPEQVRGTLEPIGARIQDPALRQAGIEAALTIGRTRGVFGEAAGLLPPLLVEQFGATTREDIQRGVGGIVSAAETAAIPAPAFGDILTLSAATLTEGGLGLREQVGLVGGLAPFFPTRPREIGTTLARIGELRLRKTPFLREVLTAEGLDPETKNPRTILQGIIEFIRKGGDIQRLQNEGQVPFEVIRSIEKTKTGAFAEAEQRALEAFDVGSGGTAFAEEERRLTAIKETPGAISRRAAIEATIPELSFGPQGTQVEAAEILTALTGRAAGGISREERLKFLTETNVAQQGLILTDIEFTPEQALELQSLNRLFPRVLADLNRVSSRKRHRFSGEFTPVGRIVNDLITRLNAAKTEANSTQIFGDQVDRLAEYQNVMREAIRFLRRVQAGETVENLPGIRGTAETVTPTEQNISGARGSGLTESLGLTGSAVGSAQTVIVNQNGPESRTQNNTNKATTQPSE